MSNVMSVCPSEAELGEPSGGLTCTEPGCGASFRSEPNLLLHRVKRHGLGTLRPRDTQPLAFRCPVIGCAYHPSSPASKSFSARRLLKQHYVKVHAEKRFSCNKCGAAFAAAATFARHERTCGAAFICSACGWEYRTEEALLVHLKRKHPQLHRDRLDAKRQARETLREVAPSVAPLLPASGDCSKASHALGKKPSSRRSDRFTQTAVKAVSGARVADSDRSTAQTQTTKRFPIVAEPMLKLDKGTDSQSDSPAGRPTKARKRTLATQTAAQSRLHETATSDVLSRGPVSRSDYATNGIQANVNLTKGDVQFGNCPQIRYDEDADLMHMTEDIEASKNYVSVNKINKIDVPLPHVACDFNTLTDYGAESVPTTAAGPGADLDYSVDGPDSFICSSISIQTQTALDELLYSDALRRNSPDFLGIFSEPNCLSDIQTQTGYPDADVGFAGLPSRSGADRVISTQTQTYDDILRMTPFSDGDDINGTNYSPDFSFKETQTCFCFLDPASEFCSGLDIDGSRDSSCFNSTAAEAPGGGSVQTGAMPKAKANDQHLLLSREL